MTKTHIISSQGELIVYQSSRRLCVGTSTFSNMNISKTSRPVAIKFYLKHYWVGEKAAFGSDADHIRTVVSWQQVAPIEL